MATGSLRKGHNAAALAPTLLRATRPHRPPGKAPGCSASPQGGPHPRALPQGAQQSLRTTTTPHLPPLAPRQEESGIRQVAPSWCLLRRWGTGGSVAVKAAARREAAARGGGKTVLGSPSWGVGCAILPISVSSCFACHPGLTHTSGCGVIGPAWHRWLGLGSTVWTGERIPAPR